MDSLMGPHSATAGLNPRQAVMQSWDRDKKSLLYTQACKTWEMTNNNNNNKLRKDRQAGQGEKHLEEIFFF